MTLAVFTHAENERLEGVASRVRGYLARHRADILCLTVILAFFLIFFWPIFLKQQLPLIGDPMYYSYPMRTVAWDMLRRGELPLWTPLIFSGYPLLSMAQLGLGYPGTWAYLFLPGHWAETVYVILPFLLAPAFLFAYLKQIGRGHLSALLGGLSFAYGGMMSSKLSNGMLPNAVMWLPLFLIAIERSRRGRLLYCIVGAATVYAMSILTGIGQGFVLTGVIAGAYATYLALLDLREKRWQALRPVVVAAAGALLAIGVAAFQILESLTALRLSVRSELTYEIFGQLSLPIRQAFAALWIPLYYHVESAPYLSPVVFALAGLGVYVAIKSPKRHQQAFFWMLLAIVSAILIAGIYTPFYRLLYHVPILNKFRGGSRHTFGWTLSISVLSAYGCDFLATVHERITRFKREQLLLGGLSVGLIGSLIVAFIWWRDIRARVPIDNEMELSTASRSYIFFKGVFVVAILAGLWCAWRMKDSQLRIIALCVCLAWMLIPEAFFFMRYAWAYSSVESSWFEVTKRPTRFIKDYTNDQERIYLRIVGFDPRDVEVRNLDFLNLSAPHKLQNIAGYEPLILERYSRALGGVWLDGVRKKLAAPADFSLFDPKSKVLDLLSTTLVAGYSNLQVTLPASTQREGVSFSLIDFRPERSVRLGAIAAEGNAIAVVSNLSNAGTVPDGTPVARIKVLTQDGSVVEQNMLAGRDTAEWAHQRPDVRGIVKHKIAKIFARFPGDARDSFPAYRYWSRIPLGRQVVVDRVEIEPLIPNVPVTVAKASLVDGERNRSTPLAQLTNETGPSEFVWLRDRNRWEKVYDRDEVLILKNKRAMPRAWLVDRLEVVTPEEALRRIQGKGVKVFDPATTALFEIAPSGFELNQGDGASAQSADSAKVIRSSENSLVIETDSVQPRVLVTSEINYPGWEATVDGNPARIYAADYILRGVCLTAGKHRVEMRYRAPGARRGAAVSLVSILIMFGLVLSAKTVDRKGRNRANNSRLHKDG